MRALVTGASRGIGRSICLRIAKDALARGEEAIIVATATGKSPDLGAVVAELSALGARASMVTGDLADPDTPARIVGEALAFSGGLDALVHNAGFPLLSSLDAVQVRHWDKMFAVNVRAMLLLGREAHPALKDSKGSVCAISSAASKSPSPDMAGYSASKAALAMLIDEMALSWGPDGVRANAVSPGFTHSRSTERAYADPEAVAEREQVVPLRRLGQPEDVAAAVSFLIGPDAAYITGVNLLVDGGKTLGVARAAVGSATFLGEPSGKR